MEKLHNKDANLDDFQGIFLEELDRRRKGEVRILILNLRIANR